MIKVHNFNPIFIYCPHFHPMIMSHTFTVPFVLKNIALNYGRDSFQSLAISKPLVWGFGFQAQGLEFGALQINHVCINSNCKEYSSALTPNFKLKFQNFDSNCVQNQRSHATNLKPLFELKTLC
jgi:hypothetical protein